MEIQELANILHEMYHIENRNKVTQIHLFGIRYCDEIRNNNYSVKEIVSLSGISLSYVTELHKGLNLARYVNVIG